MGRRRRSTHPHATYGSTTFIMATDALLILTKAPLKIFLSLIIWTTFLTLGLTPLILGGHKHNTTQGVCLKMTTPHHQNGSDSGCSSTIKYLEQDLVLVWTRTTTALVLKWSRSNTGLNQTTVLIKVCLDHSRERSALLWDCSRGRHPCNPNPNRNPNPAFPRG